MEEIVKQRIRVWATKDFFYYYHVSEQGTIGLPFCVSRYDSRGKAEYYPM